MCDPQVSAFAFLHVIGREMGIAERVGYDQVLTLDDAVPMGPNTLLLGTTNEGGKYALQVHSQGDDDNYRVSKFVREPNGSITETSHVLTASELANMLIRGQRNTFYERKYFAVVFFK